MNSGFVLRRLALFFFVVWAAASVNFFIPRLATGRDPIREKMGQLAATGGLRQEGIEAMVKAYQARFGLDRPLHEQYFNYLIDTFTLDLGYSLANYPARVDQMIADALPWTIGLLLVATLLGFVLGTLVGALVAWPRTPRFLQGLILPLMTLSAIPFYLLGLILLYFLGLEFRVFPLSGGYAPGTMATPSLSFALEVLYHSTLPALSIVLAAIGFWGLGMRGMMVSTVKTVVTMMVKASRWQNNKENGL